MKQCPLIRIEGIGCEDFFVLVSINEFITVELTNWDTNGSDCVCP